ncbi:biopolymer transport protein ExbD [Rhodopirellula rubra]|uniref:Biopolymer transport protein ExbD n=1 Tax=Aporhodopirellula rubra TaxID=980271 RepID=A0A7W5DXY8_9BACT|nr:biopolymer transporter ExbD [Aporhodopirellula rubra]MBB3205637.1 biopolymer transport protein ExbD [Aporhodopirellula rubra]
MKAPARNESGNDDLAMTSMIDVVFLLLVFFVWTSSFDKPETELASRIAMPAKAAEAIDASGIESDSPRTESLLTEDRRDEVIIRIIANDRGLSYQIGAITITDLATAREKLAAMAAINKSAIVIIDPDDSVTAADCIDVFDAARQQGFANVLFAIESA